MPGCTSIYPNFVRRSCVGVVFAYFCQALPKALLGVLQHACVGGKICFWRPAAACCMLFNAVLVCEVHGDVHGCSLSALLLLLHSVMLIWYSTSACCADILPQCALFNACICCYTASDPLYCCRAVTAILHTSYNAMCSLTALTTIFGITRADCYPIAE